MDRKKKKKRTLETSLEYVCPSWTILCLGDQDSLFFHSLALGSPILSICMFHMGRAWAFSSYSTPQGISPLPVYITSDHTEFYHKLHLLIWLLPWDIQHLFLGFQKQHQKGDPWNLPFWDLSCFAFPSLGGRSTGHSSGQARNTSGHS